MQPHATLQTRCHGGVGASCKRAWVGGSECSRAQHMPRPPHTMPSTRATQGAYGACSPLSDAQPWLWRVHLRGTRARESAKQARSAATAAAAGQLPQQAACRVACWRAVPAALRSQSSAAAKCASCRSFRGLTSACRGSGLPARGGRTPRTAPPLSRCCRVRRGGVGRGGHGSCCRQPPGAARAWQRGTAQAASRSSCQLVGLPAGRRSS